MKRKRNSFRVLDGGGGEPSSRLTSWRKAVCIAIFALAAVIALQVFAGWVYLRFNRPWVETIAVVEHVERELAMDVEGSVLRQEKVILAPFSGVFFPVAEEGRRTPVGGKLGHFLSAAPSDIKPVSVSEATEERSLFMRVTGWIGSIFSRWRQEQAFQEESRRLEDALDLEALERGFSSDWKPIVAPVAGLVSYGTDAAGHVAAKGHDYYGIVLENGWFVQCGEPLLRIIDNFLWHYRIVVPVEKGRLLASRDSVEIVFPPEGRRVCATLVDFYTDYSYYTLIYAVQRDVPVVFKECLVEAQIIYDRIKGVVFPRRALIETEDGYGVFKLQEGVAVFENVNVVKSFEDTEEVMLEDFPLGIRVVLQPERVEEGQWLD